MPTSIRERERDWDFIKEQDKIYYLLQNKLGSVTLFQKASIPPAEFNQGEKVADGLVYYFTPDLQLQGQVTLYATLNRQLEIDFNVARIIEPGTAVLEPVIARISKNNRLYTRYANSSGFVSAANFQISKHEVAIDNTRPQVANKVIFSEFERQLTADYPGIKIYDFADRERPAETKFLNRSPRSILVQDTSNPDSYKAMGDEFEDYGLLLQDEGSFEAVKRRYIEEHVNSVMSLPILIDTGNRSIPIAFMHCEARGENRLDLADHRRWLDIADQIIERIGDANTMNVKDKQRVVNISEGGVGLAFDNADLMKYLPHQSQITFDLVFRLQAPMRFRGKVVHIMNMGDHFVTGVDLEGSAHSDARKSNKERLQSLIRMAAQDAK